MATYPETPGPSAWLPQDVAAIDWHALPAAPVITAADIVRPAPGVDLWDFWPVQEEDGHIAAIAGAELWMALSAAAEGDPALRHDRARIRLLRRDRAGGWSDLGPALPDGLSPGSREWSGSAIVDAGHSRVTLFFTAAGRRGEASPTFEQRLFHTRAAMRVENGSARLSGWTPPLQSVASDGDVYDRADQRTGEIGRIKAFRDPFFFRDPADGTAYLLFTGSLGRSTSAYNGAIGIARAADASLDRWTLLPPLVTADALNNELERPHVIHRDGRYHLFWSTQASVFAPDGPVGPTGLYAMAARALHGGYRPSRPGALVLCNPPAEPLQAYSWLVLTDGVVISFIDRYGLRDRPALGPIESREHFGGSPAPMTLVDLC